MAIKYKQLTVKERNRIKIFLKKGYTYTEIAKKIGFHKSTICREIQRNSTKTGKYDPLRAQKLFEKRQKERRQPYYSKKI